MADERQNPYPVAHGVRVPRGLVAAEAAQLGHGRFGRMFPSLPYRALSPEAFAALYEHLFKVTNETTGAFNSKIPAGYTYLGQFIDHDITFDATSRLGQENDPLALVNFRTPSLELDSLYGAGPRDQPFLYEFDDRRDRGVKLLIDRVAAGDGGAYSDLPRNSEGLALIGDPRNDEHLIIAQLHLLLVRFHNAVVDHVRRRERLDGPQLLREAQRIVRWHFQWIVVHDFLRTIVGPELAGSVLGSDERGPTVRRDWFAWEGEPYIPVEFSGAAYRFGHSMVRTTYKMNADPGSDLPLFPPTAGEHLGGFRRLPPGLVIDWRFFFDLLDPDPLLPQESLEIDTHLSIRLFELPSGVSGERIDALPLLNLRRAQALRLPAGPDVASAMGLPRLTTAQLELDQIASEPIRAELLGAAPLWYYVLCEARALRDGEQLGPVGGRIVAEVLVGLLEGDPSSYLRESPSWAPELPGTGGDFTMADLVRFTQAERRLR